MQESDLTPKRASILVAAEAVADAALVSKLLRDEFDSVFTSTKAEMAVRDFEQHRPVVLVLAFDTLEGAQRYYLGLYRLSTMIHTVPHRTIILCRNNELRQVYDLCRKEHFDDYVLFWPVNNDAPRLCMAVHNALRQMKANMPDSVTVGELAGQARRLAELEPGLKQYTAELERNMDNAGLTVKQAEQAITSAFNELAPPRQRDQSDGSDHPLDHSRLADIQKHFRSMSEAIESMRGLSGEAAKNLGAQLAPMQTMLELAGRVRPVILVVEDDNFQQKLLGKLFMGQDVEISFASSAVEALGVLWRRRADLILMDVDLPEINGIEATHRIKSVPQFAAIPVVMVTGHSQKDVVVHSLKAGAVDFLVKPIDRATLLGKLRLLSIPITS
jgi:CheY-like chemotaxis protein